jgi:oligoribonuclease
MPSGDYLVWIDLEMTGLKPDTDSIIEIATVVTDRDLNLIADGPVLAIAQLRTLEFLAPLVNAGSSPMCGNSICQDRRFLARCMPGLESFFHYRNLDVSTLKELARRWAPAVAESFLKQGTHLAHADIHESIRELRHYRARLFAPAYAGVP